MDGPERKKLPSRDAYEAEIKNLKFPSNFLNTVLEERRPGQYLFAALGDSFFNFLSRSGVLEPLKGRFDGTIRDVIREFIINSIDEVSFEERTRLTPERYLKECLVPNEKWFWSMMRRNLLHLFELGEQLDNTQLLTDLVGQYQKAASQGAESVGHSQEEVRRMIAAAVTEVVAQERIDPLTGLGGRRAFQEHIDYIHEKRPSDHFTVLFIDLDHFKQVNDKMGGGHAGGDTVLKRVGTLLQKLTRDGSAFRYGGEELVVILDTDDEVRAVRQFAENFRTALQREVFYTIPNAQGEVSKPFHISASVGVSFGTGDELFEVNETQPDEIKLKSLIHRADVATYQAKGKKVGIPDDPLGRNRIWVYGRNAPEPRTEDVNMN